MPVALLYLGILVAAFFLLIVRPQRRQMAAHRALVGQPAGGRGGRDHRRDLRHDPWSRRRDGRPRGGARDRAARRPRPRSRSASDRTRSRTRPRSPARRAQATTGARATARARGARPDRAQVLGYLIGTVAVVVIALVATLVVGNKPVLGLDLQGGISVVLFPVGKFKQRLARRRHRHHPQPRRRPRRGRAGDHPPGQQHRHRPPGREGPRQGERLVGQTAELRFRPVLADAAADDRAKGDHRPTDDATTRRPIASCDSTAIGALDLRPDHVRRPTTRRARASCCPASRRTSRGVRLPPRAHRRSPARRSRGAKRSSRRPGLGRDAGPHRARGRRSTSWDVAREAAVPEAGRDRARRHRPVGAAIQPDADVRVFDGTAQITGSFTEGEARGTSRTSCNYGALPVELEEDQTVENVSPTLGKDQLRRRHRRRVHRPRARGALHARLLPAARASS